MDRYEPEACIECEDGTMVPHRLYLLGVRSITEVPDDDKWLSGLSHKSVHCKDGSSITMLSFAHGFRSQSEVDSNSPSRCRKTA